MWTKRNDHAPKSKRVEIFQKRRFSEKIKFDHRVFSCLHLLFPRNHFIKILLQQHFSHMGPYLCTIEHLFCLSHCKTPWTMSMNNVSFKICLLRTLDSMVTVTFFSFGVNRSGPGTSSTTNRNFYKALGRLHGRWCKQPLRGVH